MVSMAQWGLYNEPAENVAVESQGIDASFIFWVFLV